MGNLGRANHGVEADGLRITIKGGSDLSEWSDFEMARMLIFGGGWELVVSSIDSSDVLIRVPFRRRRHAVSARRQLVDAIDACRVDTASERSLRAALGANASRGG